MRNRANNLTQMPERPNPMPSPFSSADLSRIIEMAWEDRTPFEAIEQLYGLNQHQLIKLLRRELTASSFRLWRARTSGRASKHLALRSPAISRAYCPTQYKR